MEQATMTQDSLGGMHTGTVAGSTDQRYESRVALEHQPEGRLTVCTPFERLETRHVRDVSRNGISVEVDRPIAPNTPIKVEYQADRIDISVNGRLAWLRPPSDGARAAVSGGYLVGIELFSPGLLLNFLPVSNFD